MGTGEWANDQPRNLVIPPGAGPNDPRIVIGPDVPAILIAYYTTNYNIDIVVDGWIGFYTSATAFHYEFGGRDSVFGQDFVFSGWVLGSTVMPAENTLAIESGPAGVLGLVAGTVFISPGDPSLTGPAGETHINEIGSRSTGGRVVIGDNTGGLPSLHTSLDINTVHHGWGIITAVRITTSGALVTTSGATEANIGNYAALGVRVFTGRMYRIAVRPGQITGTVATDLYSLRVRRDTTAGTIIAIWQGNAPWGGDYEEFYTPPADAFVSFFLTIARASGTGTFTVSGRVPGGPQSGGYLLIEDVGDATDNQQWQTG